ncbi:hypothetical protein [Chryseosolibacter indicus]|uniref:Tetratricopeptide repeat protein n=1 Tax=Chryseosolibacter indicus TaxID=2782351 RepID=A0ABS5VVA0_9BACT|nr:hypothetical protein [Chryseosolibacter indicus]MBT1705363.1 hypothetical protein [Chryseosolibacter indicus]
MTKIGLIAFVLVFALTSTSNAQKVKYKDIFGLLSTRQYEQAEPFLQRYLKENTDNPNAYLYMGIVLQEKALKMDLLKQTSLAVSYNDSSIQFYDKAYKLIDEREVKKNKEYYQIYNRRDLRTGEFGVKLSDIQFDIEKKVQGLRERNSKIKAVKYNFSLADSLYNKRCNSIYASLQTSFANENQLYLRGGESTIKLLRSLRSAFDSSLIAFETYKSSVSSVGRLPYNQNLVVNKINNFQKDGGNETSFYDDNINIWDYKTFADKAIYVIEKEMIPTRANVIGYDIEINKLKERLDTKLVSVRSELSKKINKSLYQQLQKYDIDPLPILVFSTKTADLEYRSLLIEHKEAKDSSDLHYRRSRLIEELDKINRLDSISERLESSDINEKAKDYSYYISYAFKSPDALKAEVKQMRASVAEEKIKKNAELTSVKDALKWIVDGVDSIPLVLTETLKRYKPLFIDEDNYTVGLVYKDSLNNEGYFYTITNSRRPSLKVKFPVEKASFKQSKFSYAKTLTYASVPESLYYVLIYSENALKEKYPASLAKISSTGLIWSSNLNLNFIPNEMVFNSDKSEIIIKDEVKKIVIDKNGKVLR